MSASDKDIVLTITAQPVDGKGKRKIVVAGAREGEMPLIRTGTFADLYKLIDDVWIEVNTRTGAAVKGKTGATKKAKPAPRLKTKKRTKRSGSEAAVEEPAAAAEEVEETPAAAEPAEEQLPVIEGDTDDEEQLSLLGEDGKDG